MASPLPLWRPRSQVTYSAWDGSRTPNPILTAGQATAWIIDTSDKVSASGWQTFTATAPGTADVTDPPSADQNPYSYGAYPFGAVCQRLGEGPPGPAADPPAGTRPPAAAICPQSSQLPAVWLPAATGRHPTNRPPPPPPLLARS